MRKRIDNGEFVAEFETYSYDKDKTGVRMEIRKYGNSDYATWESTVYFTDVEFEDFKKVVNCF